MSRWTPTPARPGCWGSGPAADASSPDPPARPDPGRPDPGKHPRLRGWKQLAAVDPMVVGEWWRRWPQANLAVATGRRFDVLDLDGKQGIEALRAALSIAPTQH